MTISWMIAPSEPVDYASASRAMHALAERRANDEIPDTFILLEHRPVYTAGRRTDPRHLLWEESRMRARGAELHQADRGGSVTFHGPGQLVGYPIVKLASRLDVIPHLRRMEEAVIRTGSDLGIPLTRDERQTGVWAGRAKVCAIGVRLSTGRVTMHGFGLNCSTDLSWFDAIVPCGLTDRTVTSLSQVAGARVEVRDALPPMQQRLAEVFGTTFIDAPEQESETMRAAIEGVGATP